MANIDYEHIYKLTFNRQWSELLKLVYEYSKAVSSDELVMNALRTFEDEFFGELDKGAESDNVQPLLENLFLLDKGRIYKLSEERSDKVIVKLAEIYSEKGLRKEAYNYAIRCPKNKICAEIIELHQKSLPKVVEHSQSEHIRVTENRRIGNKNYTTSLFKSKQEFEFFIGVRDVFQMFIVYPNVALSCIVNFEKIKNNLSQEEINFFFRGIVDCVVFDQHNDYKPIKFFELDSFYHDSPEQKQKDSYKDKILSLAGQKLYRVRKTSENQGINEFTKLIREME
ncbi:DUF2726 domain-containing protein [Brunnivagina elsteri]|nr:DUF2726 domain-containing protein [Calothrix elsteri]